MLPSGLQMLPLLWLLLWTPTLGLSSFLSSGDVGKTTVHEDVPSEYIRPCERVIRENAKNNPKTSDYFYDDKLNFVQMVDIKNEVYKQFRKSRHSVYMVFNKTEVGEVVPEPSLLCFAQLHMHRLKQHQEQIVSLYQIYRNNSWHYLSHWLLSPSNRAGWLWFNVTEDVRRWLKKEVPIEVFRLRATQFGEMKESVLHMDISGITPNGHSGRPDSDNRKRPFLLLLTTRLKQFKFVNGFYRP